MYKMVYRIRSVVAYHWEQGAEALGLVKDLYYNDDTFNNDDCTATKNDHLKNTCKCVIDTVGFSKLRDTFFLCTKQGVQLVISLGQFPGQFALKNLQ